jgi:hypothetical protein
LSAEHRRGEGVCQSFDQRIGARVETCDDRAALDKLLAALSTGLNVEVDA